MIKVKDLTKTYETYERGHSFRETVTSLFNRKILYKEALKGITFEVEAGELLGFIGPNGAGKSTALKILSGILHPTSGEVNVLGYTPWKQRKKYVANIGAVFGQKSQLFWDVPPIDAFYINKEIYSVPSNRFNKTMSNLIEMLDAKEIITRPTRTLSLGERMKCEFIMAMLHEPKVVFLDEPTIGLDIITKDNIRKFITEMNKLGSTFILTTHDIEDIEKLAKRVIVINHGEIVFNNSINSLKNHLGEKKIIQVTTEKIFPQLPLNGVNITKQLSNYSVELELDISVTGLNEFISYVNEMSRINDLSVRETPIESAIKDIYTRD